MKKGKLEQVIQTTLAEAKKKIKDDQINEEVNTSEEIEEETVEEETAAASSLKPAAKAISDPQALSSSSVGRMSGVMNAMSGMGSSDQINFFNQVMAQYGPGKVYGVGDNSGHNQSSIDTKLGSGPKTKDAMPALSKEDVDTMFGGETLSEEFKEKASVLFEAAVNTKIIAEMARIEEEYKNSLTEELKEFTEGLTDKLDAYLDYVVENWMAENEVAIESTLRNELMEEFINGLKNLFVENYITVPESKVDVLESLAIRVEETEARLNEALAENIEMKKIISEAAKKEVLDELSEDLALTQQEKFKTLSEGIDFDGDLETYEKKLRIVKETYFVSNGTKQPSSNIEEETFEGTLTEETVTNPAVNRYVQALSRSLKK